MDYSFMLWIWVAIAVIAAIVEIATVQMVSVWFTVGALAAIIAYAAKGVYWVQVIVFFAVSVILLLCFRRVCMKWILKNIKERTNADALIGTTVRLSEPITRDSYGAAPYRDVTWTVAGKDGFVAEAGEHVKIVDIQGNKLIVEKADEPIDTN